MLLTTELHACCWLTWQRHIQPSHSDGIIETWYIIHLVYLQQHPDEHIAWHYYCGNMGKYIPWIQNNRWYNHKETEWYQKTYAYFTGYARSTQTDVVGVKKDFPPHAIPWPHSHLSVELLTHCRSFVRSCRGMQTWALLQWAAKAMRQYVFQE